MKKWNAPEMQELEVKMTASGIEANTYESESGGFVNGSFVVCQYYDSTTYEKCNGGTVTRLDAPGKASTES